VFHTPTRILLVLVLLHLPQIYWGYRAWSLLGPTTGLSRSWRPLLLVVLILLQIPWITFFGGRSETLLPLPDILLEPYRIASAVWALGALAAAVTLLGVKAARFGWRVAKPFRASSAASRDHVDSRRRRLLQTAATGLSCAPWLVVTYGVTVGRLRHRVERVTVEIPDLPAPLDGFRIVQLTDIHVSEDTPPPLIERFVEHANALDADLAVLTGDYLAFDQWGLDECVGALSSLHTRMGVVGCLGNHEIHADATNRITSAFGRRGVDILRDEGRDLDLNGSRLRIVGVDYQRSPRIPLENVKRLTRPRRPNLLLSHNPNVFPRAAELGFDLTLSGHTHGGQVRVEVLERDVAASWFMSPYVNGLYRKRGSQLYVSRGIGTTGLPIRLGAPPEITLITLRRT